MFSLLYSDSYCRLELRKLLQEARPAHAALGPAAASRGAEASLAFGRKGDAVKPHRQVPPLSPRVLALRCSSKSCLPPPVAPDPTLRVLQDALKGLEQRSQSECNRLVKRPSPPFSGLQHHQLSLESISRRKMYRYRCSTKLSYFLEVNFNLTSIRNTPPPFHASRFPWRPNARGARRGSGGRECRTRREYRLARRLLSIPERAAPWLAGRGRRVFQLGLQGQTPR